LEKKSVKIKKGALESRRAGTDRAKRESLEGKERRGHL
jgi:hypothetical protein